MIYCARASAECVFLADKTISTNTVYYTYSEKGRTLL